MILFQIFIFGYLFFYVYFLCKQRIYLCPLYHSLIPYDKYENIEQIFLDNGTSLLVFMPLDNNATIFVAYIGTYTGLKPKVQLRL